MEVFSAEPWETRPGWTDIKPIAQNDGPSALVSIAYQPEYRNAMDAWRYLISINERSERALELTECLIRQNPGHYSVWAYRAEVLLAIKADLDKELDLLDELVEQHLKSYQVWQHRRTIVLALGSPARELGFTSTALAIDAKNYHTWAYRQWALSHFWGPGSGRADADEVWAGELRFVDSLLADDIRNNSAWSHRFFCVFSSGAMTGDQVDRELAYAREKLTLAPNNASAWMYARGVLKRAQRPLASWIAIAEPFLDRAYLAAELIADAHAESAAASSAPERTAHVDSAIELYTSLCTRDPIRTPLYTYRQTKLRALVAA